MTFTRTVKDDYPVPATISINGTAIDVTDDTVKFSYSNADNASKSITGVANPNGGIGEVLFYPNTDTDFQVGGVFDYDIERVDGEGYTSTHDSGFLLLDGEITPS